MGDWPDQGHPTPTHLNTQMRNFFPISEGAMGGGMIANSSSGAWPSEKLAIYIPFSLPQAYIARRLFWVNGSAAGGEWNMGIMTSGFELLTSTGAVAGSGNSLIQYASTTETFLAPGSYILTLIHSATTANQCHSLAITAVQGRMAGLTQQAVGSMTIPTSGTPAKWESLIYPLCGLTRTSTGF